MLITSFLCSFRSINGQIRQSPEKESKDRQSKLRTWPYYFWKSESGFAKLRSISWNYNLKHKFSKTICNMNRLFTNQFRRNSQHATNRSISIFIFWLHNQRVANPVVLAHSKNSKFGIDTIQVYKHFNLNRLPIPF